MGITALVHRPVLSWTHELENYSCQTWMDNSKIMSILSCPAVCSVCPFYYADKSLVKIYFSAVTESQTWSSSCFSKVCSLTLVLTWLSLSTNFLSKLSYISKDLHMLVLYISRAICQASLPIPHPQILLTLLLKKVRK